jgi:glutamate/tyrosine decarboxylase-like PLP-dependent enzyme
MTNTLHSINIAVKPKNLLYYIIYAFSGWLGGLYGTMNDEGSSSCVQAFCALITLLYYGKQTYCQIANDIYSTTTKITNTLSTNKLIEIITPNPINVVTIKLKLRTGSTYRFSDLMHEKGFIFNTLTDNIIHFCITKRFVSRHETTTHFLNAVKDSIDTVQKEIDQDPNIEYDGNARIYCSVDKIKQISTDVSFGKYIENYFFGTQGIIETIKMHFMSINNPFYVD